MTTWRHVIVGVALALASLASHGQAVTCTKTLNPGANLTQNVETATDGDTICLNAGDYNASTTSAYADAKSFGIAKRVRIVGLGATPADVRLNGGGGGDYAVKFLRYPLPPAGLVIGNPTGASLENVTVQGSNGGVVIQDSNYGGRLSDIRIRNVVVKTALAGVTWGMLAYKADKIVIDGASVESYQAGISLIDNTDALVMNSTVVRVWAANAVGLQVFGGERNVIVNNTIGSPKANPADNTDSSYIIPSGNTVFYNSKNNRLEGNTLQGHRDDGLDFTALDLSGTLPPDQAKRRSADNYAGKNTVISTGFAAGRVAGSGIWVNCGANNAWLYANDSRGSAECGTCVWNSNSALLLGNKLHDNRLAGIVVSGGKETEAPYCTIPAYINKPTATYLRNNFAFYNGNEQVVVRKSNTTDLSLNFFSSTNGYGGAAAACVTSGCQAAFAFEGDPADPAATSAGVRVANNISADNQRGIQGDDGKVSGFEFFGNRMLNAAATDRFVTLATLNIDAGSNLGGNFWARHTAFGNPSSNAYAGVFHNLSNQTGLVVDRFPYQTEDFGRGPTVTVFEPKAGSYARGSKRTVRWSAPGCTYVDISINGTLLASSQPNNGYSVVTIPESTPLGSHAAVVRCRDSFNADKGATGSSPSFTVTPSSLQLLAPGRDDVFNTGQEIWVGWTRSSSTLAVDIDYSSDGGANFTRLASGVTDAFKRVVIPGTASSAYGIIKISATGGLADSTDGVFAVRGTSGAGFTNIAAGRKFVMGNAERLEWASPQNSRLVTITATRSGTTKTVATNYPDRGNLDWIVDDMGGTGTVTFNITFKQTDATTVISTASNGEGTLSYPTTITFGSLPSIAPGGSGAITATTNFGGAVTFTSLTPAVCTVNSAGSSLAGVAGGTCTIQASSAGDATHAAYTTTISFTIGQGQTITFGTAPTVVVNGTGTVSATASSGLPVTFSTLTPSVCTVTAGTSTVNGLTAGTCNIAANQAGNGSFSAAPQVTQSFEVVAGTSIVRLANISTRGPILTGNDIMIGGFIIGGAAPKKVLIRAIGPSLAAFGVTGTIPDPKLELYSGPNKIAENDNWQSNANATDISATGLAPTSPLEGALLVTLNPGAYTAAVSGVNGVTGVGIIEVFEASNPELPLLNISTRGQVQTVNNVMIGGFIIQGTGTMKVLITARGPSLAAFGITAPLLNPKIEIYSGATKLFENDDWQVQNTAAGGAGAVAEIAATGIAPSDTREAALMLTLNPGAYTAVVSGVGGVTGVGIIEVFKR
jgi:hypothetical protein